MRYGLRCINQQRNGAVQFQHTTPGQGGNSKQNKKKYLAHENLVARDIINANYRCK